MARGTVPHMTLFCTRGRAQHVPPLEELKAGLANDLVASISEKILGAAIPRADFAAVGHRKRRVGGVFEELEEIAIQHHGQFRVFVDL